MACLILTAWCNLLSTEKISAAEIKIKPIKPVDNFWKGNFQKRPVPWKKEQLGAFPSYKVNSTLKSDDLAVR